ncbi:MAG: cell envelope protein SmpA [Pseudomonas sp.]|uniref:OmpA family protein n=1 Tax=Pseudomonas sp. TaxID=306 RepID=UPI000CB93150|nr:OmpA family protein [Pseudomonas sp.]PJI47316.1 MAG: cell envelope protein SmpA [Pseudomonas sp.]
MNAFKPFAVRTLVIACASLLLAACGTHSSVDEQGHSAAPQFPSISDSYRPQGSYVNLENLAKVQPGMGKVQLYELLGTPHFQEGLFGVREWDYILRFRRPAQADLVCQYKVLFDKDMQAQSFLYSPADCQDQLKPAVAPAPQPVRSITLSADTAFAFDRAQLSAAGQASLQRLASQLQGQHPNAISITGHTDRLGSRAYNLDLSLRRAEAVRDYLVGAGVPAGLMQVHGVGAAQPITDCPDAPRDQLSQCLAANRRVIVEITAAVAQPIKSEE